MIAAIAFLRTPLGMLSIASALILAAFFYGDHRGAQRVIQRVAAERAAANEKALTRDSAAKETAAIERAKDAAKIEEKHDAQINAIQGKDDAAIRHSTACQRVREARGDQAASAAGC